ncbi:hypothetical protein SM033_00225 [Vibrio phage vB_VpaM_sm033]|nr:hypothetical protein SM033_00225 [Vibrio phage vB_VpaM_sm033]
MYKSSTLHVQGLLQELMRFVEEGMTVPFCLCIYDVIHNPHDALAIKNTLELFPNIDIRVAIMSGNNSNALLAAAAVPAEKRYITSQGIFSFSKPVYVGQGSYKDLKIAAEAQKMLEVRIDEILDKAYKLPKSSHEMHKEQEIVRAEAVRGYGFQDYKEIL